MPLYSGLIAAALASEGSPPKGVAFNATRLTVPLSIETRDNGFVIRRHGAGARPPAALPLRVRLGSTVVFDILKASRSRATQAPIEGPKL